MSERWRELLAQLTAELEQQAARLRELELQVGDLHGFHQRFAMVCLWSYTYDLQWFYNDFTVPALYISYMYLRLYLIYTYHFHIHGLTQVLP